MRIRSRSNDIEFRKNHFNRLLPIILIVLLLYIINVSAQSTNISILYAFNGVENVPIQVDSAGRLKTTLNLSRSTGLVPEVDNVYDIGSVSLRWKTGYFVDLVATGNITIDTNTLFVDGTSNRVGIGTLSPTAKLDVNGTGPGNLLRIGNASNDFFIINGTTGFVGVGTAAPLQTLVVVGTVNITDSLNVTNNIETGGFFIGDGSLLTGITTGSTGPFNSSGTNVFLNNSGSSVGIGTRIPYNTLTVIGSVGISGSLNASSINITGNAYFATSSGNVGIGNTIPKATLDVSGIGKFNGINITGGPGTINLTIGNGTGSARAEAMIFHNGSGICIGSC